MVMVWDGFCFWLYHITSKMFRRNQEIAAELLPGVFGMMQSHGQQDEANDDVKSKYSTLPKCPDHEPCESTVAAVGILQVHSKI